MKIVLKWKMISLIATIIFFPLSVPCETVAFSPSIPGQPLIFHKTTPSVSTFEETTFKKLSKEQTTELFALAESSARLSEGLLGLIGTSYLPTNQNQKTSIASLYNDEISTSISSLYQIFLSQRGSSSNKLAKLVRQTLLTFVEITNQMLVDTVGSSTNTSFQLDYQQMQLRVINSFIDDLKEMFKERALRSLYKARAVSSLEGLVSCLSLYISTMNSLVNGGNAGSQNMVLSRQQVVRNLIIFVEATFLLDLYSISSK